MPTRPLFFTFNSSQGLLKAFLVRRTCNNIGDYFGRSEFISKRVLEAFNRHDLDAIMAFFADDCVFEMPRGPHPWGQRFAPCVADSMFLA